MHLYQCVTCHVRPPDTLKLPSFEICMQLSSYIFSPLLIKKGGLLQLKFGGVGKDLLLFNWRPVFVIYIYFVVIFVILNNWQYKSLYR